MPVARVNVDIPELDDQLVLIVELRRDFQQMVTALQEVARKVARHERVAQCAAAKINGMITDSINLEAFDGLNLAVEKLPATASEGDIAVLIENTWHIFHDQSWRPVTGWASESPAGACE